MQISEDQTRTVSEVNCIGRLSWISTRETTLFYFAISLTPEIPPSFDGINNDKLMTLMNAKRGNIDVLHSDEFCRSDPSVFLGNTEHSGRLDESKSWLTSYRDWSFWGEKVDSKLTAWKQRGWLIARMKRY